MIFVYPALVSENVDPRYIPAICASLENFYLLHIGQAFQSSRLKIAAKYNKRKNQYDEFFLESAEQDQDGVVLLEQEQTVSRDPQYWERQYNNLRKNRENLTSRRNQKHQELGALNYQFNQLVEYRTILVNQRADLEQQHTDAQSRLEMYRDTLSNNDLRNLEDDIRNLENRINAIQGKIQNLTRKMQDLNRDRTKLSDTISDLDREIQGISSQLDYALNMKGEADSHEWESKSIERQQKQTKHVLDLQKAEREKEKSEGEKEKEERESRRITASARAETVPNIDWRPSLATLKATVKYYGGPGKGKKEWEAGPSQDFTIGCQVLPIKARNYARLFDVLIDDFYASKFVFLYRAGWRYVIRKTLGALKGLWYKFHNFFHSLSTDSFSLYRDMLLNQKGLVDASSFRRKKLSPKTQIYASAIVILDSTDISTEETNFFENPKEIRKIQLMGWHDFAIVDHPNTRVIFCSHLNRGACSVMPYSYIFHALKSKEILDGLDPLKKQATPFRRMAPPIKSFARQMMKESQTRKYLDSKLMEL